MFVQLKSNIAAKGLKRDLSYRDLLSLFNISFQLKTTAFIENEALGSTADILLLMSLLISVNTTHNDVGLHVRDTVNLYNMKVKCTVYTGRHITRSTSQLHGNFGTTCMQMYIKCSSY
jgi:hypothetical protein